MRSGEALNKSGAAPRMEYSRLVWLLRGKTDTRSVETEIMKFYEKPCKKVFSPEKMAYVVDVPALRREINLTYEAIQHLVKNFDMKQIAEKMLQSNIAAKVENLEGVFACIESYFAKNFWSDDDVLRVLDEIDIHFNLPKDTVIRVIIPRAIVEHAKQIYKAEAAKHPPSTDAVVRMCLAKSAGTALQDAASSVSQLSTAVEQKAEPNLVRSQPGPEKKAAKPPKPPRPKKLEFSLTLEEDYIKVDANTLKLGKNR